MKADAFVTSWYPIDNTNFQVIIAGALLIIYAAVRYVIIPERAAQRGKDPEQKIKKPAQVEKRREQKIKELGSMDVRKRYLATRSVAAALSLAGSVALIVGVVATGFGLLDIIAGERSTLNPALSGGAIAGGVLLMFFGISVLLMAEAMLVLIDVEHNTRRTAEMHASQFAKVSACPSCGKGIASDLRFCSECGSKLMSEASV